MRRSHQDITPTFAAIRAGQYEHTRRADDPAATDRGPRRPFITISRQAGGADEPSRFGWPRV